MREYTPSIELAVYASYYGQLVETVLERIALYALALLKKVYSVLEENYKLVALSMGFS